MHTPPPPGTADPRYSKRLAIIVPYRDRAEHLAKFVPHLVTYFQRDKLDRQIAVTINIIEQRGNAPFSRGRLGNCGFLLTRDTSDYVCIHDVDYLPMWADYSWTPARARLIWHGLTMKENWETFFGAVSLLDNAIFAEANGFPNCYWGWGPEDLELGLRCRFKGVAVERRDGTYIPLRHAHAGFTNALFATREPDLRALLDQDGVNSLKYELVEKKPLTLPGGPPIPNAWHYLVDIGEPAPGEI